MDRLSLLALFLIVFTVSMTDDAHAALRKKRIVMIAFDSTEARIIEHATPEELIKNPQLAATFRQSLRAQNGMDQAIPDDTLELYDAKKSAGSL